MTLAVHVHGSRILGLSGGICFHQPGIPTTEDTTRGSAIWHCHLKCVDSEKLDNLRTLHKVRPASVGN